MDDSEKDRLATRVVHLWCSFRVALNGKQTEVRCTVEGLSDRGSTGIVEQNLRLCERSDVWYFVRNYVAGVPPASFFASGSREYLL
jgi:hypothetical protein